MAWGHSLVPWSFPASTLLAVTTGQHTSMLVSALHPCLPFDHRTQVDASEVLRALADPQGPLDLYDAATKMLFKVGLKGGGTNLHHAALGGRSFKKACGAACSALCPPKCVQPVGQSDSLQSFEGLHEQPSDWLHGHPTGLQAARPPTVHLQVPGAAAGERGGFVGWLAAFARASAEHLTSAAAAAAATGVQGAGEAGGPASQGAVGGGSQGPSSQGVGPSSQGGDPAQRAAALKHEAAAVREGLEALRLRMAGEKAVVWAGAGPAADLAMQAARRVVQAM